MLENFSGSFNYCERILDRVQLSELSDDYTLPDYMPAVGRVLSCTASLAPPALYIGGGSVEYAGGVRYRLLYESADDSSLWCAELPAEYDVILSPDKLTTDPAELSGIAEAALDNISVRITAPRRLTLKSRIRLCPLLSVGTGFEASLHGASDPEALCVLKGNSLSGILSEASSSPIVCKDRIAYAEAGLAPTDEIRIISSHGEAMISSLQINGTNAECRGEVSLSILLSRIGEGERPRRMIRKLPFSATVPFENMPDPEARRIGIRGYASCPSVAVTAEEESLSLEADLLLCVEAAAAVPVSYIKDIYSKTSECEYSQKKLTLRTPVACFNGNATVSCGNELEPLGIDSGMKLCEIAARILTAPESTLSESGKLTVSGKLKVSAIADNGAELFPVEFDSEFRYTAEIPEAAYSAQSDAPEVSLIATVGDIKGRLEPDRIVCDCELCTAVLIESKQTLEAIAEVSLTPASRSDGTPSRICVCYPVQGETLWDVAKKYRTDAAFIAERNSLDPAAAPDSPESLAKANFLII